LSSGGESLTAEVRAGAATCAAGFGGLRFHKYRKKYDGKKYFSSSAGFFSASDEIPWRSPSRGLVLSVPPL
ncbi:hypothetical protein, partial [Pseudomonas aeruginosa]